MAVVNTLQWFRGSWGEVEMGFWVQKPAGVAALMLLLFSASVHASLLGADIRVDHPFPTMQTIFTERGSGTVTDAGLLFSDGVTQIAVGSSIFSFQNVVGSELMPTAADFNGYLLTVLSGGTPIIGLSTGAGTTQPGFSLSQTSFDATHVYLNIAGTTIPRLALIELDLQFGPAVPEPASIGLFLMGSIAWAFLALAQRIRD